MSTLCTARPSDGTEQEEPAAKGRAFQSSVGRTRKETDFATLSGRMMVLTFSAAAERPALRPDEPISSDGWNKELIQSR